MVAVTLAIGSITVLFILLLLGKHTFPGQRGRSLCALCGAVSLTGAGLLVLSWIGWLHDPALVGLLVGNTVIGLYYLIRERLDGDLRVFQLPAYLSLLFLGYHAITLEPAYTAYIAILAVWSGFFVLYLYRQHDRVRTAVDQIVACCREW